MRYTCSADETLCTSLYSIHTQSLLNQRDAPAAVQMTLCGIWGPLLFNRYSVGGQIPAAVRNTIFFESSVWYSYSIVAQLKLITG
jgi:hypothetical protein